MHDSDQQKENGSSRLRAYEPILHLIGLPIAAYLLFGVVIYGLLSLLGVLADPLEMSVASNAE